MEAQVLELHTQGKSAEEISKILDVPLYKVIILTTTTNG